MATTLRPAVHKTWLTPGRVPIRYRLLASFAVPLTIWILVSVVNVAVWDHAAENNEELIRSQQIILLANEYIGVSLRAQAAKRGFLMTSDNTFLTAYREAAASVNRIHDQLVDLVRSQPEQQERLHKAGSIFQQWLYDASRQRIEARRQLSMPLIDKAHELEKSLLILQDAHMRANGSGNIPHDLINTARSSVRDLLELGTPGTLSEYQPGMQQALRLLDQYETALAADQTEPARQLLRESITLLTRAIQAVLNAEYRIKASVIGGESNSLLDAFQMQMNEFIKSERQRLGEFEMAMADADERARLILWAGPALGLLLMIVMTSWMSRRVAYSIENISRAARGLARGDLSARAKVEGSDEFAVLADRFNSMAELVENRSCESAALAELGELLQSSTSINEAAKIFAELATKLFPHQPGALYLMPPSRDEVVTVASWESGNDYSEPEFLPEDCWALRLSRAHENAPRNSVRCSHLSTENDHSICLPLHAFGETLGMLFICDPADGFREGSIGAEQHRGFIDTVAEQLALALANLRMRETLRHQSIRDPLTQLYNRRYLDETFTRELHRATRRQKPLSLLTFDIDHFKRFNDMHGHDGGDAILKTIGNCLRDFFRSEDGAFRSGGEEFVAVLPETTLDDAASRAEELREQISVLEVQHGNIILPPVTISVGVATFPQHGDTTEQLLKAADRALYRAKECGRNRVCKAD